MPQRLIRQFDEIGLDDVGLVGGKNASLGELQRALGEKIHVAPGFAVTAEAYRLLLHENGLEPELARILDGIDRSDAPGFAEAAARLRQMVRAAKWPRALEEELRAAYRQLEAEHGRGVAVAVRSSATAEDLPNASFAGQHESFLNVRGAAALADAVARCFASLFTERAISYRIDQGFRHDQVALSVGVQKMVRADKASSGVVFTLDTESGFRDVVMVTGVYGLGETIVQGTADPDEFLVHKPTYRMGHRAVLRHRIGRKQVRLVYGDGAADTRLKPTSVAARKKPCLSDSEILDLAGQAMAVEEHYSRRHGRDTPMDVEWAKDGPDGRIYIIQARPETVHSQVRTNRLKQYRLLGSGPVLGQGQAVGQRIASGPVRIVSQPEQLGQVQDGDVLVAESTSPDWEPVMSRVAAIVTEHGGRTCHAAIVARELGIPAIVGMADARKALTEGQDVTVSCAEGDTGRVRAGRIEYTVDEIDLDVGRPDDIEIMVNIANPDAVFSLAGLPVDGVGLARIEFIISNAIGIHPMALLFPERIDNARVRRQIARRTEGFADGADYFVNRLAEGVGMIAAAFHPRPVIVRTSDFKTNEYEALLGGRWFEQDEANPMIGFRGASRYGHPAYRPAFDLECRALRRVREDMGLTNVVVMIPFCRRIAEAEATLKVMADNGLVRGQNGLQVYVMCEIPSNVVQVDAFAKLFDGFSIGSNDLTQLTLGVDRDSEILAFDFDEQDPAVLAMISQAIAGAHRNGRHCGLCGQGPSDKPDFADWLRREKIDSISLNPDSVLGVIRRFGGSR